MEPAALQIAIIGGGPAGLMAAEVIARAGHRVDLYEAKPSMGRKFLVAGKGGLNLTHSEPFEAFLERFGDRKDQLRPYLDAFGPDQIRAWARGLGYETFVGTSGRVFPQGMMAAPLLRTWLAGLRDLGVAFHTRHRWIGWSLEGELRFSTGAGVQTVPAAAVVLAMGGGSWPQLGSDAAWVPILQAAGAAVTPLRPANCGFNLPWSRHFIGKHAGSPVKSVRLHFEDAGGRVFDRRGEFVVSAYGLEGSLVYAASGMLRDEIERYGSAVLHLDLAPDRSLDVLAAQLARLRGKRSLSSHLRRYVGIEGVKAGLLWEFVPPDALGDPARLAFWIKSLPVRLESARPLAEAISTAGGLSFDELDAGLMLRRLPGVFCAGEMLDWEAPTGGYLLTACLSTGRAAGLGLLAWLAEQGSP